MTIYRAFFKVMIDQSIRSLGRNKLISHEGKISQMMIITDTAIQIPKYYKQYVRYEHTTRYYKNHV